MAQDYADLVLSIDPFPDFVHHALDFARVRRGDVLLSARSAIRSYNSTLFMPIFAALSR